MFFVKYGVICTVKQNSKFFLYLLFQVPVNPITVLLSEKIVAHAYNKIPLNTTVQRSSNVLLPTYTYLHSVQYDHHSSLQHKLYAVDTIINKLTILNLITHPDRK